MTGRLNTGLTFWRDAGLPYLEARLTQDGRNLGYAKHSHTAFSIGAIIKGRTLYWHREGAIPVAQGTVVLMNPHEIHACNPVDDQSWSYCMLYVEPTWLAGLQRSLGCDAQGGFREFATRASHDPLLYHGLMRLCSLLWDPRQTTQARDSQARAFFTELLCRLPLAEENTHLKRNDISHAINQIRNHCTQPLRIGEMAKDINISPSQLLRRFKQQYGITPHGYLTDCRIRHSQGELKRGRSIADVALLCQFADQPHFQRTFKRLTAATPRQYLQVTPS